MLALSPMTELEEYPMIRRALLLLAMAGIYVAIKRNFRNAAQRAKDMAADAQWANEGGANAPSAV